MTVFSVSIKDRNKAAQVKHIAYTAFGSPKSVSAYFRELHESFFDKHIRGIAPEAPPNAPPAPPPGYRAIYISEDTFDRFEAWRVKSEALNPDAPRGWEAAINEIIDYTTAVTPVAPHLADLDDDF